jgi:uracil-DNA glycosylase
LAATAETVIHKKEMLKVTRIKNAHGLLMENNLIKLQKQIIRCAKCPRLVAWREQVADEKIKRFAQDEYWGKPVPSLGDPNARLLIVGLAPAAHGGNRTGRMFTGDRSGD